MKSQLKKYVKSNQIKFIDLFAGIGGFRIALTELNAECVFSSEWDKFAAKTYSHNFKHQPFGDITKISESEIPGHNVLCAGFPCQAFSISGKQEGFNDTRGTLFWDIARIAKHHQPEILFLENVKNLARHDNGRTVKVIYKTLEEIGYSVFSQVLNSSHYGVPQSRERVYFVCFNKKLNIHNFEFPQPTMENISINDIVEEDNKTREFVLNRKDILITKKNLSKNSDLFESPILKPLRIGTINKGGQGERIYSSLGHAITLSAYGGGAAGKTGAYLINEKVRQLSPRECLRVQGFPEKYCFPPDISVSQSYKMCGNSVSVPVISKIFSQVIQTLSENKVQFL